MTENAHDQKARSDVETYGCHILKVFGEDELPPFAYSIGIEATSHQPDLLVVGLDLQFSQNLINDYNDRVRNGEVFVPNVPYDGFLAGFPVFFSPMLKQHYQEYLGWGLWFYEGDDFRTFQLIYPTTSGVWPWDPEASDGFRQRSPILSEPVLLSGA